MQRLCHPTEGRALTEEEIEYVNQCSIAAMKGFIVRGMMLDDEVVKRAWDMAFAMLKNRDGRKMTIGY